MHFDVADVELASSLSPACKPPSLAASRGIRAERLNFPSIDLSTWPVSRRNVDIRDSYAPIPFCVNDYNFPVRSGREELRVYLDEFRL